MKPEYLIALFCVFAFLFVLMVHVAHDDKRINKARRALGIPKIYHQDLKYLLFSIYKHHPYMYRLEDHEFRQVLREKQAHLYKQIEHELDVLVRLDQLILDDDLQYEDNRVAQRPLSHLLNNHHIL